MTSAISQLAVENDRTTADVTAEQRPSGSRTSTIGGWWPSGGRTTAEQRRMVVEQRRMVVEQWRMAARQWLPMVGDGDDDR